MISQSSSRRISPQNPTTVLESCESLLDVLADVEILVKAREERRPKSLYKPSAPTEGAGGLYTSLEEVRKLLQGGIQEYSGRETDPTTKEQRATIIKSILILCRNYRLSVIKPLEATLTGDFREIDYQPYIQVSNGIHGKVGEAFGNLPTAQTVRQGEEANGPILSPVAESSGAKTMPGPLNEHGA